MFFFLLEVIGLGGGFLPRFAYHGWLDGLVQATSPRIRYRSVRMVAPNQNLIAALAPELDGIYLITPGSRWKCLLPLMEQVKELRD